MSRTARIIVGLIVLGLIVAIIGFIYIWVSGGSGAPSATLSAPTLAIATRAPTVAATEVAATTEATTEVTAEATSEATTEATEAATEAATGDATAEATSESAQVTAATAEATTEATPEVAVGSAASDLVVFNIVTDDSEVRFILNEVLRGSPNAVTGRTNQIAGQIAVDFANPQNSQVGEIRISSRSLATDNELRNRAIRGQILQSSLDEFEFISFKPTEINGLPASVTMGVPFEFQLTGDLTIRDITQPVTFDVTVTPESETRIEGTASATVQRGDYNLIIPNVPGVADVDEAVQLEVDFAAEAQAS